MVIPARGNSIGCVTLISDDLATCTQTTICSTDILLLDVKYLYYCSWGMKSKWFVYAGSAIPQITVQQINENLVPIPPLKEQNRIVYSIEKLLPYVEKYKEIDERITVLNNSYKKGLKKAILQFAIQGKLVKQNPNDEPANRLIERILDEKRQLMKDKKIKKKNLSIIYKDTDNQFYEKFDDGTIINITDEIPFDIPEDWCYTRMSNIIELLSGRDLTPNEYNDKGEGIPYLTGASNIEEDGIVINRWTNQPKVIAKENDLLLTCKGTVGTTIILSEKEVHIARQIMALRTNNSLTLGYLKVTIDSYVSVLKSKAKSMIPGISRDDVLNLLVAVPPKEEQNRIIKKIDSIYDFLKTAE